MHMGDMGDLKGRKGRYKRYNYIVISDNKSGKRKQATLDQHRKLNKRIATNMPIPLLLVFEKYTLLPIFL